jgi:C4-dicarboxylate-binding protein DctP
LKSKVKALAILLIFTAILAACGDDNSVSGDSEGEEHSFRLSLNVPPTHVWTESAEIFKQELEEQSDGRLTVELFPNSQLGETRDITQMLNQGTLDFAYIPTAFLTANYGELNAWYMPFLFEDVESAIEMATTSEAQELLELFSEQGLVGIDWAFTDNHHVLVESGILDTPESYEGKKLRAPGTDAIDDLYNELGASSVAMPLSEIYTSMQTGVIDGLNASVESVVSNKYYEVANEFTLLNQTAFNSVIVMSEQTQDKLAEADREIVHAAFTEAVNWLNEEIIKQREANFEELEGIEGFNIHEVDDHEPFYEARDTIYEKYSEQYPEIEAFINKAETLKGE